MNSILLDALDYYYNLNKLDTNIKYTKDIYNLLPVAYISENDKFVRKVYNFIGFYIYELGEFVWAWRTNINKIGHIKTNQLILHAINIEPVTLSDFFIKKLLTSSNIKITRENEFILILIFAISCYLTKAHTYISERSDESNYMSFCVFYDVKDVEGLELDVNL